MNRLTQRYGSYRVKVLVMKYYLFGGLRNLEHVRNDQHARNAGSDAVVHRILVLVSEGYLQRAAFRVELRRIIGRRRIEAAENKEHPMNRIIEIRETGDGLLLTTTDVHLPRRIGKAVQAAWKGSLDIHFDEGGYFTRIAWRRDE